jgi:hypothetical protein
VLRHYGKPFAPVFAPGSGRDSKRLTKILLGTSKDVFLLGERMSLLPPQDESTCRRLVAGGQELTSELG